MKKRKAVICAQMLRSARGSQAPGLTMGVAELPSSHPARPEPLLSAPLAPRHGFAHLISPNTEPAFRVTSTVVPSGPPSTCTCPAWMMYISRPISPCNEDGCCAGCPGTGGLY